MLEWLDELFGKRNPSQEYIARDEGQQASREPVYSYQKYYEELEIVNRAVNMVVDDASQIDVKIGAPTVGMTIAKGIKRATVDRLLNSEPNPFQDISTFRRNLLTDFVVDGNIFIYWDGAFIYHLPANRMVINPSPTEYVESYTFGGTTNYSPSEIIHIKDNSFYSIYRGISRLKPALRTMKLLAQMRSFQDNFFKNGAIPGLVIKSPDTLSEKIKERMLLAWSSRYRPDGGGRRPLILDGGMELEDITKLNFKDLDFQASILVNEETILKAVGVPPIMMNSGNNANIRPNHRMYYLETVLPIVKKVNTALERFFGFMIEEDLADVPALQPELREQAAYVATLVNGGIMYPNEARELLGLLPDPDKENDKIRIPANVAGSAVKPETGGKPKEPAP